MAKCAKESPLKFVSGNTTGRITSAAQVRKLRFEAKQEKIKEDGVHPTNDMSDCLRTMSNIIAADISTRPDKREDGKDVLKGIVRRCEFVPTCNDPNTPAIAPDIVLHERSMCAFFGELCETHKHQLRESMIDLGDANVKWSMRKGDDGFKKKKERGSKKERNLPAIDETVYITFKKAGDVEIGCKIVIIHNMKTENKKRKSK